MWFAFLNLVIFCLQKKMCNLLLWDTKCALCRSMHPPDELKAVPVGITEVGQPWSSQDLRCAKFRIFYMPLNFFSRSPTTISKMLRFTQQIKKPAPSIWTIWFYYKHFTKKNSMTWQGILFFFCKKMCLSFFFLKKYMKYIKNLQNISFIKKKLSNKI